MLDDRSSGPVRALFDATTATFQGARAVQQDTVLSDFPLGQSSGFAVIADGMGGHAGGEIASALAAAEMYTHLKMHTAEIARGSSNLPLILQEAAEAANARIAAHMAMHQDLTGMGTTLLVPVLSADRLSWVSVGDSVLFVFRDGALRKLNKAHSMAGQIDFMVKAGAMSPDTARDHPDRSILTSALTGGLLEHMDCPARPLSLEPGDVVIAATDGLEALPSGILANVLDKHIRDTSAQMTAAVLSALKIMAVPNQDNASFVVIKVGEDIRDETMRHADDMPVLAVAGEDGGEDTPQAVAPPPEPEKPAKKKRTYMYRGVEYERED